MVARTRILDGRILRSLTHGDETRRMCNLLEGGLHQAIRSALDLPDPVVSDVRVLEHTPFGPRHDASALLPGHLDQRAVGPDGRLQMYGAGQRRRGGLPVGRDIDEVLLAKPVRRQTSDVGVDLRPRRIGEQRRDRLARTAAHEPRAARPLLLCADNLVPPPADRIAPIIAAASSQGP